MTLPGDPNYIGFTPAAYSDLSTVTTYTASTILQASDAGDIVEMSSGSGITLTVPPFADVPFPTGTRIDVVQVGVGQLTIAAGSGVTIRTPSTLVLVGQWSAVSLYKRATNEWVLVGDVESA